MPQRQQQAGGKGTQDKRAEQNSRQLLSKLQSPLSSPKNPQAPHPEPVFSPQGPGHAPLLSTFPILELKLAQSTCVPKCTEGTNTWQPSPEVMTLSKRQRDPEIPAHQFVAYWSTFS